MTGQSLVVLTLLGSRVNTSFLVLILAGRNRAGLRWLGARGRSVVRRDEGLDVCQLVVKVFTADLVLVVVWIELEDKRYRL